MIELHTHHAVLSLVLGLASHDPATAQHSLRVAHLADLVASDLGLAADERVLTYNAGLLHDVGKLAIDGTLLNKEGPLDGHERESLRRHCATGADMLAGPDGELNDLAFAIACHHERLDGSGYPRGLRGDDLPISARILATVDVYDAVRSPRPYRSGVFSDEQAHAYLEAQAGRLFDADCVAALARTASGTVAGERSPHELGMRAALRGHLPATSPVRGLLDAPASATAVARRRS